MFPGPTELLLIGYSMESIWTQKYKSNTSTPKNQLADMLTKGNFTRDEWNHLLCLFNISHFSSINCSEVMAKRTQEESGEERVTAKSRPMMNLIARAPSIMSSSASESPGKRSYKSHSPLSANAEIDDRTGRPIVCRDTSHAQGHKHQFVESTHSWDEWDDNKAWSSQEWKADEVMDDRTVRPVVCPQRGARTQQFIIGNDETESGLGSEKKWYSISEDCPLG